MAETEEEEDLLLEQHRAFVPGDDREAAEATPYWADAVALLEKHKRARAAGEQLAERADHERALGRFGEALVDLEHFVKRGKMETAGGRRRPPPVWCGTVLDRPGALCAAIAAARAQVEKTSEEVAAAKAAAQAEQAAQAARLADAEGALVGVLERRQRERERFAAWDASVESGILKVRELREEPTVDAARVAKEYLRLTQVLEHDAPVKYEERAALDAEVAAAAKETAAHAAAAAAPGRVGVLNDRKRAESTQLREMQDAVHATVHAYLGHLEEVPLSTVTIEIHCSRATSLLKLRRYHDALEAADTALKLAPTARARLCFSSSATASAQYGVASAASRSSPGTNARCGSSSRSSSSSVSAISAS